MSKYMQIDIKITPFYERGFKNQFPRLYTLLGSLSYTEPLEKDASLYALVDFLGTISRSPRVPPDIKEKISPFWERLMPLKEKARESLLSRRLNELDQLLYKMEDEFEDLEKEL